MEDKLIPYRKVVCEYGVYGLYPLNPTGRWMYKSGPYYKDRIYVEHKGFLFKSWIGEDYIVFRRERSEEIFNCEETV